ncbi:flagellar basal body rod protein FlgC [Jeotgalibaca porci]|uniref:Flagellar basal-body rod protein FlgC n=2 Tax=Jeotgalibaca porci TaxID=1868793 RepID=A0A6G7WHE3_9LACT|nr:flagellar basal body rod protein FlgC [Jeotgalibaca porci]QIK51618.1 flagellar basal body rod protein FlgC [Jeotgalibaca porci]
MAVFDALHISSSGLSLERLKLDTFSTNIANVNTTRTEEGGPYQRKSIVFEEALKSSSSQFNLNNQKSFGVRTTEIATDETVVMTYDPSHPDANAEGYVASSNVNMADEMVNMMNTIRAYEANATALEAGKDMLKQALLISAK